MIPTLIAIFIPICISLFLLLKLCFRVADLIDLTKVQNHNTIRLITKIYC